MLLLYGAVGVVVGFSVVAAAPGFMGRASAGLRPGQTSRNVQEIPVRWTGPGTTSEGRARFEAECTVPRIEGWLFVEFPSGGPWSVRVNGRVAYHDVALDGSRARVGPAARWLGPGVNKLVATCESGGVENPPRLLLGRGR